MEYLKHARSKSEKERFNTQKNSKKLKIRTKQNNLNMEES
jgi:hypothetical protein